MTEWTFRDLKDLCAAERSRFAFYPSREKWRKKAESMGLDLDLFDRWADTQPWWAD